MTKFALVEDNQVTEVVEQLPVNWRYISNLYVLSDELETLKQHGWYLIVKYNEQYDSNSYELSESQYVFRDGQVFEQRTVVERPQQVSSFDGYDQEAAQWRNIRTQRDAKMKQFEWRYSRYYRQLRLNLTPTDSLEDLDRYMQALADIPSNFTTPDSLVWPVYGE